MLRYLCIICLVLIGWSESAYPLDTMRPKLACFPLAAKSIDALAYNENISALLVNAIDRSGVVELIERKKIEAVIEQRGLRLDTLDHAMLRELGAQAGFDFILTGLVGRNEGKLFIDLSLIGTHSQKATHNWNYKIGDGEISAKLEEITAIIIPKMREAQNGSAPVLPVQPPPALTAPTDLQCSGTSRSIRLRWNQIAPEHVSGYRIYRATASDGTYSQLASSSTNYYSDENLELNDRFYYKVRSLGKRGGESEFSLSATGSTIAVPQPPVFMQAEPNVRCAALSWYQRTVSGPAALVPVQYRVYRAELGTNDFKQITQLSSSATSYTDLQLSEGTGYRYYLTAVNASGGESEQSAVLEVTTVCGVGDLVAVSGQIRKIPLTWKPHSFASIEGYFVYRSEAKDGTFVKIGRTDSRDAVNYTDAVDGDNASRWYRITGINKDGSETLPGNAVSGTTRPVPPAPAKPTVTSGEPRRVKVSWQASGNPEDEKGGYCIYRSTQERGDYTKIVKVAENLFVYLDASVPLLDNTAYWYRISAYNSAGIEGFPSGSVKAVTKAKPAAPKGLSAKSGEVRKVSLSWQPGADNELREYLVWRKNKEGTYTPLGSTKVTGFVEADLDDGVQASYTVSAVDLDGLESDVAPPVTATTEPAPARASGARLERRGGQAGIAWDRNPETNVRTYYVYRKGFLGRQKLGETSGTEYFTDLKDKQELFVTAVNVDGLESEPSATVIVESH
jgi:uncharacterized protein